MKFKSGRGGWRGGGRPKGSTIATHLKRINLNDFRLPKWIVDWLKKQNYSGGRLIEEAIVNYYKLTPPQKDTKERG